MKESPKVNNLIEAKLLLAEAYDITFNIFDHVKQYEIDNNPNADPNSKRPLAVIAFHEAEDTATHSALYEKISTYSDIKIKEYFGLSLLEYLDLPTDVSNHISKIASDRLAAELRMAANLQSHLNSDQKK